MLPKKFIYEESGFFGGQQIIQLKDNGLEFGEGEPFALNFIYKEVSLADWKAIEESIKEVDLDIRDRDEDIMDGTQVSCWITFKKRLVKFEISNPNFSGYKELRKILNDLTRCEEYPTGIFIYDVP